MRTIYNYPLILMWFSLLASLSAAALIYLSDRQQRWLDRPLPTVVRALGVLMALASAALWVLTLGLGVGLMVAMWLLLLAVLLMSLWAGHYRASFQKVNGKPGGVR